MTGGAAGSRSDKAVPGPGETELREAGTQRSALPGAGQTPETIERWIRREAAPEAIVVVRHAQLGLYEFHLDEVVSVNATLRRIYLAQHGTFGFDGAGTAGARGQLTLLEPTADVLDVAINGRTWQHGRPAFQRPLSALEWHLVASLGRRHR